MHRIPRFASDQSNQTSYGDSDEPRTLAVNSVSCRSRNRTTRFWWYRRPRSKISTAKFARAALQQAHEMRPSSPLRGQLGPDTLPGNRISQSAAKQRCGEPIRRPRRRISSSISTRSSFGPYPSVTRDFWCEAVCSKKPWTKGVVRTRTAAGARASSRIWRIRSSSKA